jgi:hypothetical protein
MIANRSARWGGEGGHLLLGVRTERLLGYHTDVVVEVSPFARDRVNPKQYYDVLHAWLTPAPDGLDVRWWLSVSDPARGIIAITIPPQPRDRWPSVVATVIDDAGKRRGVSVAYVERYGEHAVEWTVADIQRLLREGARADSVSGQLDALAQQVDNLAGQVKKFLAQKPPTPPPGPSEAVRSYRERLSRAVTAGELQSVPVYALTAAPVDTVTLPALFRGPKEALPRLLADPPSLRVGGWDMAVRGELAVIEGRLRRGVARGKVLECWPDGTLIHAAEAINFLCWGPRTRGNVRRINPLGLTESAFLLAKLAEAVYMEHAAPRPSAVRFGLALHRLDVGGTVELTPGGIKSMGFLWNLDVKYAPGGEAEFTFDVGNSWTPGEVAYRLTSAVYTWFGHTEEKVPYAAEENGVPVISVEKLLADAAG